ncbi:hypothetical protein FRC07_005421 [Ceratobasidium sp. 392]|nr:hypothetical protein FRC07_005421 [Ceratobasidium sp. 392]
MFDQPSFPHLNSTTTIIEPPNNYYVMQSPTGNLAPSMTPASQVQHPSTQAPTQDRPEHFIQPDILTQLIDKLLQTNAAPGVLTYLNSLRNSHQEGEPALAPEIQQELDIMSYCRGWVRLVYCGPDSTHGFVKQEPYLNPRETVAADVQELARCIGYKKLDYRFPIDLLVDMADVPEDVQAQMQVDGSQPETEVCRLQLEGQTPEEHNLLMETWLWKGANRELLSQDEHNTKMIRLHECQQDPNRPQAHIIAGRQRNEAMQSLAAATYQKSRRFAALLDRADNTSEEEVIQTAELSAQLKTELAFLSFRARVFDASMPRPLQVELAKNQDAEFRRGASAGEDIYMFRLQTLEVLDLLHDANQQMA